MPRLNTNNVEPKVLYEDKNFLAVLKPAGLLVHKILGIKGQASKEKTLIDWLLRHYPEVKNVGDPSASSGQAPSASSGQAPSASSGQAPSASSGQAPSTGSSAEAHSKSSGQVIFRPGIVHRLDKDTSGVLLVAKNQKYFQYLKKLFQSGDIKKTYLALVLSKLKPKTGFIDKAVRIKSGSVKRTVWRGKNEKKALTEYRVLKYFPDYSLVEVFPKTGRTHQIRVHLASIGHPIVGDTLYGPSKNNLGLKRQFLHGASVEFSSETGRRIKIESDLPYDLQNVLNHLQAEKQ